MRKFERNERVIFNLDGVRHRGRVTQVNLQARRVVTDSGRRFEVPVRRLRASPDRALILEARLDRNLRSSRSYGPMMLQWLSAYNAVALYERVHTVDDMRRFLRREGKNVATRFVHIMAHGVDAPGKHGAALHLTFEKLHLIRDADVFAGLDGKVLIFSSCELGADREAMEAVKKASGAAAVVAYRVDIDDWYTNLSEVMLYDRLLSTTWSPSRVVDCINALFDQADIRVTTQITRKPVLVCF